MNYSQFTPKGYCSFVRTAFFFLVLVFVYHLEKNMRRIYQKSCPQQEPPPLKAPKGIYLLYSGYARLRRKPVLHAVIRPAFVSGCIWSVGFLFMIKGIHESHGLEVDMAAHRPRFIGAHPNHFPYDGLVHPITLDLCAAKLRYVFFLQDSVRLRLKFARRWDFHREKRETIRPMNSWWVSF